MGIIEQILFHKYSCVATAEPAEIAPSTLSGICNEIRIYKHFEYELGCVMFFVAIVDRKRSNHLLLSARHRMLRLPYACVECIVDSAEKKNCWTLHFPEQEPQYIIALCWFTVTMQWCIYDSLAELDCAHCPPPPSPNRLVRAFHSNRSIAFFSG